MEVQLQNGYPPYRRMVVEVRPMWLAPGMVLEGQVAVLGAIDPLGRQDARVEILEPPCHRGILLDGRLVRA